MTAPDTVIPATPDWFVLYVWLGDADLELVQIPIIAWEIASREMPDTGPRYESWPITPCDAWHMIENDDDGEWSGILQRPDGLLCSAVEDYHTITKDMWLEQVRAAANRYAAKIATEGRVGVAEASS
jgi:hypothetical protein